MLADASCCSPYSTLLRSAAFVFFFFNDTATTEIYTLSLHDALPIYPSAAVRNFPSQRRENGQTLCGSAACSDRKSTRLNSSHRYISDAGFCLEKKNLQLP